MTIQRWFIAWLGLGVSVCSGADSWRRGESARFEVFTDVAVENVEPLVAELEQFRTAVTSFLKLEPDEPGRIRLVVFRYREDFARYFPISGGHLVAAAGYAVRVYYAPGIVMSLSAGSARERAVVSRPTVFHELVHLLYSRRPAARILWFQEGLADYFSSFEVVGDTAKFGVASAVRMKELRGRWPMRLSEVFALTPASSNYAHAVESGLYPVAWAFVHYHLSAMDPAARVQLFDFVDRLTGGAPPTEETFRASFGYGFAEMEDRLERYFHTGSSYRVTQVPLPVMTREKIAWMPLDPAVRDALLCGIEVYARLPADGEARLQRLVEQQPASLAPRLALASLAQRRSQTAKVRDVLRGAAELEAGDSRVPAYAAKLTLDVALHEAAFDARLDNATVTDVRSLAWKALRADPRCLLAAESLARAEAAAADPRPENAAEAERLLPAMPERAPTLLALAVFHYRAGEAETARQLAGELRQTLATPPGVRHAAEALLAALDAKAGAPTK